MRYIVLDTDVASRSIKRRLDGPLATKLTGAAWCLARGLPLASLNSKDYADFAEHEGLILITG